MPTELELIALKTEFDLYLGFTKRLVINLPNSKDRCRAAMWLQKLREVSDPNQMKLRNEHLKLLLFALHRRSMVGVFGFKPPEELESFHDGLTLTEMTRELIEITEAEKASGGNLEDPTKSPLPPIYCNLSADFKEYTSAQEIPKFGAHVFYAISNEPIQFWNKRGATKYPAGGDIPNAYQWELAFNKIDDGVLANQAEIDRQIKVAKAIEAGEMTEDDLHPPIDFSKKIHIEKANPIVFKWKKDSYLTLHQNYDNAGNGPIEDLQGQGKNQLELDEDAFSILDRSLPGRLRVVVRDPFYKDLPVDVSERRTHGIVEEIPEPEEDDEPDEPEEDDAPCNCDQIDAACNEDVGNQDMNCQFDQPPGGFDPCMCQECTGASQQNGGNQNQQQFYGGNGNMNNAPCQAPPPQQGSFGNCQGNQGGNDGGGACTCNRY